MMAVMMVVMSRQVDITKATSTGLDDDETTERMNTINIPSSPAYEIMSTHVCQTIYHLVRLMK